MEIFILCSIKLGGLMGEGVRCFWTTETDGGGGLNISILAGRPLWMPPNCDHLDQLDNANYFDCSDR